MPTCPKGHTSEAADYCDECGAPIGAAPIAVPAAPPSHTSAAAKAKGGGEPCPECSTPRTDRFCEVCGHDFLAAVPVPQAAPQSTPEPAPQAGPPAPTVAPAGWKVVVSADRAYYERMRAAADADAPPVTFPAYCPERRFALTGEQILIGRLSRTRGIEPQVDLTGPPEDVAVSHMHALLVATPDGWSVVDLDSANGTYLNEAEDQLAPHQPVPLKDGDRVHLGGWTTLTVRTS